MTQNNILKVFKNLKHISSTIYEYSPQQIKQLFFQENIDIKGRDELVKNIHSSLFKSSQK